MACCNCLAVRSAAFSIASSFFVAIRAAPPGVRLWVMALPAVRASTFTCAPAMLRRLKRAFARTRRRWRHSTAVRTQRTNQQGPHETHGFSVRPMGENLRDAVEEKGQQPGVVLTQRQRLLFPARVRWTVWWGRTGIPAHTPWRAKGHGQPRPWRVTRQGDLDGPAARQINYIAHLNSAEHGFARARLWPTSTRIVTPRRSRGRFSSERSSHWWATSVQNNRPFINPVLQGSSPERRRPATSGQRRLTRTKHIRSRVLLASAA